MPLLDFPSGAARTIWDAIFVAMDDEGVSNLVQRRIKDRVLYGNPNGPTGRRPMPPLTGSKVPADILERMEAVRKQSGTG